MAPTDASDEASTPDAANDAAPALPTLPAGDAVAVYEVDAMGDPIVRTRKPFFTTFPNPWGAYFEPNTGDFIFLTWGRSSGPDVLLAGPLEAGPDAVTLALISHLARSPRGCRAPRRSR